MVQDLCTRSLQPCLWFGGYEGAQRRVLGVFPDYMEPAASAFPIQAFCAQIPKGYSLTHRDFLGAILALGIKREVVGDILIEGSQAWFFVLEQAAALIAQELCRVGRVGIRLEKADGREAAAHQRFEERDASVASMRLDAVVSALCACSRGQAAALVQAGLVSVRGLVRENCSAAIESGDTLSVRGKGKFIVESSGATTKKGRTRIHIKRYI